MDTLSDILADVYVSGTVFGHATFFGDWSVFTRGADFAIFHAVIEGAATIVWNDGRRSQQIDAGSMVVVPRGAPHVMCSDPELDLEPTWINDVFDGASHGVSRATSGDGPLNARIICGTFRFDQRTPNRLTEALPDVMFVPGSEQQGWVERTLRWMDAEVDSSRPGADVMVTRLTDTLFVHVVRASLEQAAIDGTPWLAALGDRHVSRALAAIHREPQAAWTAASLARAAGMSRSSFYPRFSELVGETPAQYLLGRRMDLAAHGLTTGMKSVSEVAADVGYRSESSFSKAFKRHFGVPPSEFR